MHSPAETKLFFDARTIRPGMTGVGRSALGLLGGLAAREDVRIRALILEGSFAALDLDRNETLRCVEWIPTDLDYEAHPRGDFALRFRIPSMVRPGEVYHGPAFSIPGGRQPFPRVVTIYDLGVFARPDDVARRFGLFMRWSIRRAVASADRIIVPTRATAEELKSRLGVPPDRIRVVPCAAGRTGAAEARSARSARAPYILSIGTLEPRKDPLTAARAFELLKSDGRPELRWIWAGAPGHQSGELAQRIAAMPFTEGFEVTGSVAEPRMEELLRGATALVYPSLYEGFGMPPLEAMALGVPVVAADIPAVREVCSEAALYFVPGDAADLSRKLNELLKDEALRSKLGEAGGRRAAEFTWEKSAAATAAVYGELKM